MSTRCNVIIQSRNNAQDAVESVQLYHHHDGYPKFMAFFLCRFLNDWLANEASATPSASDLSKALLAVNEYKYMNDDTNLTDGEFEDDNNNILHGDIEYLYIIDLHQQTIRFFKIGTNLYFGESISIEGYDQDVKGVKIFESKISESIEALKRLKFSSLE